MQTTQRAWRDHLTSDLLGTLHLSGQTEQQLVGDGVHQVEEGGVLVQDVVEGGALQAQVLWGGGVRQRGEEEGVVT